MVSSAAAATDGSFNLAGISNPAVDALADRVLKAENRAELVTATRALDRVLLPPPADEEQLRQLLGRLAGQAFDLRAGPLLRAFLVEVSAGDHALLLLAHHIVSAACARWANAPPTRWRSPKSANTSGRAWY